MGSLDGGGEAELGRSRGRRSRRGKRRSWRRGAPPTPKFNYHKPISSGPLLQPFKFQSSPTPSSNPKVQFPTPSSNPSNSHKPISSGMVMIDEEEILATRKSSELSPPSLSPCSSSSSSSPSSASLSASLTTVATVAYSEDSSDSTWDKIIGALLNSLVTANASIPHWSSSTRGKSHLSLPPFVDHHHAAFCNNP